MAPKKDAKSEKGQKKAEDKAKMKVVEDKTFGLKNKNKSKAVQKYIKGVQQQGKPQNKGGDSMAIEQKNQQKEAKKKELQQEALLNSLFRGTENVKRMAADQVGTYDPAMHKQEQKADLYVDRRDGQSLSSDAETGIVCKHYIDAVERKQYGWFWECPNGGDACRYRHCLPAGYILKEEEEEVDNDEESIEEAIERERAELTGPGTPVTLETFTAWKAKNEEERLRKLEEEREAATKKTGGRGLEVLTGKDLFAFDPSLFVDDEDAAIEDDYEEDDEPIEEEEEEDDDEEEEEEQENEEAGNSSQEANEEEGGGASSGKPEMTEEELVKVTNEALFLDDDIPDDLDDLDDLED